MKDKPYRSAILVILLAIVCLAVVWREVATSQAPEPVPPAADTPFDPRPLAVTLQDAALALRAGDCASALASAAREAATAPRPELVSFFTVVEGLYAHACADVERAADRLAAAAVAQGGPPAAGGPLEDWRLLVLADSAAASGSPLVARNALAELLEDHPDSPLRPQALLKAARLAYEAGDLGTALAVVERARREGVGTGPGSAGRREGLAIEEVAWRIGEERAAEGSDGEVAGLAIQRAAARRLLTHYPERADELTVAEVFRPSADDTDAPLDWGAVLGADELAQRARRLLAARRPLAANRALTAVPLERRDFDWRMLAAEALTDLKQGREALDLLAGSGPRTPVETARLEWRRGMAAFETARVRRGRPPLPAEQRERMRTAARLHLAAVARSGADPELAARALRRLFAEHWDEDRTETALALLGRLRQLDPEDRTGSRPLWQSGWNEFMARNYTGAIGYWTELVSLYPESAYSRNGRYWIARAHDELGNAQRADSIYREVVAADTGDFYTRFAQARLGGVTPSSASAPLAEDRGAPWPHHPGLARARLLSDLGLDDLGRAELEALGGADGPDGDASPDRRRAAIALDALLLTRQGNPREGIIRIRDAFPVLGGPLQGTAPQQALHLYYPIAHSDVVRQQAERRSLSPYLVFGMIRQESGFDTDALSRAGALGLMQLMPATSREVAGKLGLPWSRTRLSDPGYNVTLGTAYFRQVLEMFNGDVELALAGYNGGPYRIKRLLRSSSGLGRDVFVEGLPVPESRLYVKKILQHSDAYLQLHPEAGRPDPARGPS